MKILIHTYVMIIALVVCNVDLFEILKYTACKQCFRFSNQIIQDCLTLIEC